MKTLLAAAMLLALVIPAHAETENETETQTCIGRVKIHVVTDNGGLNPKGTKELSVGGCHIEDNKRVLRTCPLGSFCRVEGVEGGDAALEVVSVARINPYREGMRDYREGLCYRARPYIDHGPEQDLWQRGYNAQGEKKPRDWSHCYGTRGKIDNQLMRDR